MKVLVTGGCGYKGHVLVPKLLEAGCDVRVVDTQWFGNFHPTHSRLEVQSGDVRHLDTISFDGVDAIIHLASIANDPCGDLNPKLTWETSCLATMQLADEAARLGIKHFIYASSGSVYGVKQEAKVTEELSLDPISEYNKTKMVAERVLLSYQGDMVVQIIRPATVCGYSPRMRLDVSVNLLTMHALSKGKITVFGGAQIRPNIHILDLCKIFTHFLSKKNLIYQNEIYNAGFENLSIMNIAKKIRIKTNCKIQINPSNDPRSYRLSSGKLLRTGFKNMFSVDDAIDQLLVFFENKKFEAYNNNFNIKKTQELNLE